VRRDLVPMLRLLDSTSITLKGRGFDDWTFGQRTARTQGLKLHVLYDPVRQAPCWSTFSAANVNDITVAREQLPLASGQCYVFDKGYCDYAWWHAIDQGGGHFVTRFKRDAALIVKRNRKVQAKDAATILADQIVTFRHRHNRAGHTNPYEAPLRRVTVARPDHARPLVLATNDLKSPAATIAARYKARWDIELFFKWIKQHLRIERFLGRSEHAVKIQILTALVAYLLVALAHRATRSSLSLWLFLAELRAALFQRPATLAQQQRSATRRRLVSSIAQRRLFA
jgi:hypothetical protein